MGKVIPLQRPRTLLWCAAACDGEPHAFPFLAEFTDRFVRVVLAPGSDHPIQAIGRQRFSVGHDWNAFCRDFHVTDARDETLSLYNSTSKTAAHRR